MPHFGGVFFPFPFICVIPFPFVVRSLNSSDNFAADLGFTADVENCLEVLLLGCSGCCPASVTLKMQHIQLAPAIIL